MSGILIAIEGVSGSGKSTLGKYLEGELLKDGWPAVRVTTREEEKEHIFHAATKSYDLELDSAAHMFFFQVLQAHKVDRAKRLLEGGNVVIANRWDISFFVHTRNFGRLARESDFLRKEICRLAFDDLTPDLGIYLDVSVEKALDRRLWRGDVINDIEEEKRLYEITKASYKSLLAERCEWQVVNDNNDFEEVRQTALELARKAVKQLPR
ncbi:MAG: hypothetical protein A2913_00925 [Parcubacteria group bacterium RIFCSPLOWO2_01_FULL_40_65]|nr:MAG: hypothetical protein A2734_02985 [Parcubacteria group bacterium RIFCSPHIGHO2_01_FULL_40_30]OHB18936.1 MAG: hypothetical protein A3D40_00445 [Parcubacteria group bacterium RIFCSPHIGHO2_02_FULL_40_12]OHB21716.1 MAG: hypothetical protein A2913_00925 [Parcubacteria group bacterium RIFCSPLOWO2_01_FULL_40_65]OHB22779.1 MAG: hypothetical protein A3I22_02705 [Parcubacteria group bacterium RIFCSPLOWO2_02_FULL_40_12]